MFASSYGSIDIVRLLCNFDLRLKFTGQSGFQPDCSLLKKEDIYKININLQNDDGWTALIIASRCGNIDIVKLLLQKDDININLKNDYRVTALMFASFFGNIDIVKLLNNYNSLLSLTNLI
jgi:serine/threonine-protein phosphatase 6 regulatory ankyrin repeat subunit B